MELLEKTVAPVSHAQELFATAMLRIARHGRDAWDAYLEDLPEHMPGKREFIEAIIPVIMSLDHAARALSSAIDEASCEADCSCTTHPYHRALKAQA